MNNVVFYTMKIFGLTTDQATNAGIPTNVDANKVLPTILNTVYWIAGSVAVIVIVIAGIYYITSQGNASQVSQAKNAIIAACIGLVVVVMAFTITQFVLGEF